MQEGRGYVFETETDTEVIAKLAKFVYDTQTEDGENNSFDAVVKAVVKELQGAYALIFKSPLFPNEMIATRRGSPLLLGIKSKDTVDDKVEVTFSPAPQRKGVPAPALSVQNFSNAAARPAGPVEYFLASDASAVIEHTRRVLYLEDGDIAYIRKQGPEGASKLCRGPALHVQIVLC